MPFSVKSNWTDLFNERLAEFSLPSNGRVAFTRDKRTNSFYWVEWEFTDEDGLETVTQLWRIHGLLLVPNQVVTTPLATPSDEV